MGSTRNLLIVAGVRPQYVKAAALLAELERHAPDIWRRARVLDTGQHYSPSLARRVQESVGLNPNHCIQHDFGSTELAIIGKSLREFEDYVRSNYNEVPTVVVFGDANPALVGAIAGSRLGAPIVHIEAGARRDPRESEHWNSAFADSLANIRCCVTERAVTCLSNEGISEGVLLTGDIAARWFRELSLKVLDDNESSREGDMVLVTLHRPGNMDLSTVCAVLDAIRLCGLRCRWVRHPRVESLLAQVSHQGVTLLEPLSVSEVIKEIVRSRIVLTDSGGLAREAHYLGRPVIMRRDTGGWPELRDAQLLRAAGRQCGDRKSVV